MEYVCMSIEGGPYKHVHGVYFRAEMVVSTRLGATSSPLGCWLAKNCAALYERLSCTFYNLMVWAEQCRNCL